MKILKENKIDIVIVSDGIIEGFIGLLLGKKYNKPFIFYLSSLFFDIDKELFYREKNIKNLYKYIEANLKELLISFLVNRADIFHPISSSMGDYYNKKEKMIPLPTCPSDDFLLVDKKIYTNTATKFISIGFMSPLRETIELISFFNEYIKMNSNNDVELILIGKFSSVNYKEKIMDYIKRNKLTNNVQIIDELDKKNIPQYLVECDVGICLLPPIKGYIVSSPTKIVEYMSVKLPILANFEIKEQKYIINSSKCGILVEYNPKKIIEGIDYFVNNKKNFRKMGEMGRNWLIKNRNYDILSYKINKEYERLKKY